MSGSWEYKIAAFGTTIAELNLAGEMGWEVVGDGQGNKLLKRPRLSFRDRVTLEQKRDVYREFGRELPEGEGDR